jgi:ribosomal-protein-alanine N-acetyltransferase
MSINPPIFNAFGLALREIRSTDAQPWFDYLRMPDVIRLTGWPILSAEDLAPLSDKAGDENATVAVRFALVQPSIDKLIGTIGFHSLSSDRTRAEIAYDLAPAYWGKGIASAACAAVSRWGFDTLQLDRIQGSVMVGNRASARILEKCGFTLEGSLREARYAQGQPCDFWIYSRLRRDTANGYPATLN